MKPSASATKLARGIVIPGSGAQTNPVDGFNTTHPVGVNSVFISRMCSHRRSCQTFLLLQVGRKLVPSLTPSTLLLPSRNLSYTYARLQNESYLKSFPAVIGDFTDVHLCDKRTYTAFLKFMESVASHGPAAKSYALDTTLSTTATSSTPRSASCSGATKKIR